MLIDNGCVAIVYVLCAQLWTKMPVFTFLSHLLSLSIIDQWTVALWETIPVQKDVQTKCRRFPIIILPEQGVRLTVIFSSHLLLRRSNEYQLIRDMENISTKKHWWTKVLWLPLFNHSSAGVIFIYQNVNLQLHLSLNKIQNQLGVWSVILQLFLTIASTFS